MSQDLYEFMSSLWEQRPVIVILILGGFAIFLLSIINTFRYRRHHKRKHRPARFH